MSFKPTFLSSWGTKLCSTQWLLLRTDETQSLFMWKNTFKSVRIKNIQWCMNNNLSASPHYYKKLFWFTWTCTWDKPDALGGREISCFPVAQVYATAQQNSALSSTSTKNIMVEVLHVHLMFGPMYTRLNKELGNHYLPHRQLFTLSGHLTFCPLLWVSLQGELMD